MKRRVQCDSDTDDGRDCPNRAAYVFAVSNGRTPPQRWCLCGTHANRLLRFGWDVKRVALADGSPLPLAEGGLR